MLERGETHPRVPVPTSTWWATPPRWSGPWNGGVVGNKLSKPPDTWGQDVRPSSRGAMARNPIRLVVGLAVAAAAARTRGRGAEFAPGLFLAGPLPHPPCDSHRTGRSACL